jgi:hypothetical protein
LPRRTYDDESRELRRKCVYIPDADAIADTDCESDSDPYSVTDCDSER